MQTVRRKNYICCRDCVAQWRPSLPCNPTPIRENHNLRLEKGLAIYVLPDNLVPLQAVKYNRSERIIPMWKSANPPTIDPKPSTPEQEKKPAMSTTTHSSSSGEPTASTPRNAAISQEQATIGKALVIKGEVTGSESLYVDGIVEGSINLPDHRVTVGRNGQVTANVTAREVVVLGKVKGNVTVSDRVDIRAAGSLSGDVICQRLSIEDGAYFKGSIDIRKPKEQANAPAKIESASTPAQTRLSSVTA